MDCAVRISCSLGGNVAPSRHSSRNTARLPHKTSTARRTRPSAPTHPLFLRNQPDPLVLCRPFQLATSESQSNIGFETDTVEWAMQDFYALRKDVETAMERVEEIRASAGLERLESDLADLEKKAADSSLWDDPPKAQETLLALTDVKDKIKQLTDFKSQVEEADTIIKLTEEMESVDASLLEEASKIVRDLKRALDRFELTQLLSGPYDKDGAVITITAGAGGTDAQDWADMLLRMYVRWGEKQRYKTKVVEKSIGEEAGIKSATLELEGRFAYGYLSGEKGTHRIVRQSPFNAKGLRQRINWLTDYVLRQACSFLNLEDLARTQLSILVPMHSKVEGMSCGLLLQTGMKDETFATLTSSQIPM